jgi:FkbM family methyltransferase
MPLSPMRALGWYAKRRLRQVGFDYPRAPDLIDFLASRDVDLVVDVGANVGQFASHLRHLGYSNRIASFEPQKDAFAELEAKAAQDDGWTCHNYALGDESGVATINVSRNTVFSSILPQTPAAIAFDAESVVERSETIEVRCLDELAIELAGNRSFLKIDTQGFEKHVLDGARSYLATAVVGLQLELPIVNLYEQTWTFAEAINYMTKNNFVLSQIAPVNHRKEDAVSLLEVDGVFRRLDAGDARSVW